MSKFKIDENLPIEIKEILIQLGHDALLITDQGLGGQPDSKIYSVCQSEKRCIVTLDLGFGDIRHYPPAQHVGIIVLRAIDQSKESIVVLFSQHVHLLEVEPLAGKLWIMENDRVRIRE